MVHLVNGMQELGNKVEPQWVMGHRANVRRISDDFNCLLGANDAFDIVHYG
jgi:hypothetical protein